MLLAAPDALPGRPVLAARRDDLRRDGLGLGGVQGPAAALRGVLDDGSFVSLLLQARLAQEPDSLRPGGLPVSCRGFVGLCSSQSFLDRKM